MAWHPFDTSKLVSEIKSLRAHLHNLESMLQNLDKGAAISYKIENDSTLLKREIDRGNFGARVCRVIEELKMINNEDLYEFMNSGKMYRRPDFGKKSIMEIERFFFSRGYFYTFSS